MKKYFLAISLMLTYYRPAFAERQCLKSNPSTGQAIGLAFDEKDKYKISIYEHGRIVDQAVYKSANFFDLEKIWDASNGRTMPYRLRLVSSPLKDIRGYSFRLSGLSLGTVEFYLTEDCIN